MAVRALLKGRDVLAVLPMGYGPRKKRFCHCQRRIQESIAPFHAGISRYWNKHSPFENYKSEEEALRNARHLKQRNSENSK